jgi:hypothetical protein
MTLWNDESAVAENRYGWIVLRLIVETSAISLKMAGWGF